jgi:hypothetical protein
VLLTHTTELFVTAAKWTMQRVTFAVLARPLANTHELCCLLALLLLYFDCVPPPRSFLKAERI